MISAAASWHEKQYLFKIVCIFCSLTTFTITLLLWPFGAVLEDSHVFNYEVDLGTHGYSKLTSSSSQSHMRHATVIIYKILDNLSKACEVMTLGVTYLGTP
jgi:hypothetical protein